MQHEPIITKVHQHQKRVLESKARIVLASAGIQGGKTTVGAIWLLNKIQANKFRGNYLILSPTYKILHQSTLTKFFEIIGSPTRIGKYNKAKEEIELLGGGGKIFIRSGEDPEHIVGMTITGGIWGDEAGQYTERLWINMLARCALVRAPILLTTTPYFLNWCYRDVIQQWRKGNKEFDVITWRSVDSPYFPQEEFDARKATMNEAEFARQYLGEWKQASGLVFPEFDRGKHVIEPIPADKRYGWDYFAGVDFGYRPAPTVVSWMAKDSQGIYYVMEEYSETGKTATEHAEYIKEKQKQYPVTAYHCDPQEVEQMNEFINSGLRNIWGLKKPREVGISKITELLRTNRLKIFANCRGLIDELERYHRKEPDKEGIVKQEPVKVDDHHIDSIRYAIVNTSLEKCDVYVQTSDGTDWSYEKWNSDQQRNKKVIEKFKAFGKKEEVKGVYGDHL